MKKLLTLILMLLPALTFADVCTDNPNLSGTCTDNLGMYKPAVRETGWGTLVSENNWDVIDTEFAARGISSSAYASINLAVAACTNKTLIVGEAETLTGNLTFPSGCEVVFTESGRLVKASTYTVTHAAGSTLRAGAFQIYEGFASGDITFSSPSSIMIVNPKWFGATGDGSTNDLTSAQMAASSLTSGQTLRFPPGTYKFSTASSALRILTDGITVEGEQGTKLQTYGGQAVIVIGNNDATIDGTIFGTNASIVLNGGFDSATTGWTSGTATLASIAGGQTGNALEITRTSGDSQTVSQSVTTVVGKTYIMTAFVKDGSVASGAFFLSASDVYSEIARTSGTTFTSWNEYHLKFVATQTTTSINVIKNNASAGTMLVDTIRVYPMTSNVTVRNLEIEQDTAGGQGAYGIWGVYTNNLTIENIIGKGTLGLIALGNDSNDDCTDVSIKNISMNGDIGHSLGYGIGLFRVYGGTIDDINIETRGGGKAVNLESSHDINGTNINVSDLASTKTQQGISVTKGRGINFTNFNVNGASSGITANFDSDDAVYNQNKYVTFSNGNIHNATTAIVTYGSHNKFENIRTTTSTTDLQINSGTSLNQFINNQLNVGGTPVLVDTSNLVRSQRFIWNDLSLTAITGATPSVFGGDKYRLTDTTTITNFLNGYDNQVLFLVAEASLTITNGVSIFLQGNVNRVMSSGDTLMLIKRATDGNWYELSQTTNLTLEGTATATGGFVGNASTATALASDPADCSAGQVATGIGTSGALTCTGSPVISGTATIQGQLIKGVQAGVTANTGSTQGTGTAITHGIVEISICANAGDALTLPTAVAGYDILITNHGVASADIFPNVSDVINEGTVDVAKALAVNASMRCVAYDVVNWECVTLAR